MFDCLNGLLRHDHMLNMLCIFSQHDAKTPWRTNTNRNKEKKPVNVNHPFSSLFTRKVCVSPFDAVGRSNVGGGRRELGHGPVNGSSVGFEEICLARIRCRPGGEHMVNGNSRILKWRYVNVPYFWPYFAGIFPYIGLIYKALYMVGT